MSEGAGEVEDEVASPRLWRRGGWTAKVVANEEDDGWAVEMYRAGEAEPALVGPWTMGRDKKNPKPLDAAAFNALIKGASDVMRRHEHQLRAQRHKEGSYTRKDGQRIRAELDIAADEDDPHAVLACFDATTGEELRRERVSAGFKLSEARLERFLEHGGE